MSFTDLTNELKSGADLKVGEVREAAEGLLSEGGDVEAKVEFLGALADKGETAAEISGFVEVFLEHAVDPGIDKAALRGPTVDVCGTGGDKLNLFNVSTTSMFVVAAAGACVLKHGNRGITSKSGGADVLEALGVRIDLPAEEFAACIAEHGVGFMLAPQYHPAFKSVVPVRKVLAERGKRTVFNLIGPLLNPARPDYQLLGAFDRGLPPIYADILGKLGRKRAWSVCGDAGDGRGMDEFSILGANRVCVSEAGETSEMTVEPGELGLGEGARLEDLAGGDATENAEILVAVLAGNVRGPKRDMVVLNAAAALAVCGVCADLRAAVVKAGEVIDSGAALGKLEALREG
ncbi:MAG: anthranilate phosphoribosyltransferase [Verrucomicrobiales bacterium]|nr:anthranilate phosphoribosyltransferase [Verrucomicrobiales bacterium]